SSSAPEMASVKDKPPELEELMNHCGQSRRKEARTRLLLRLSAPTMGRSLKAKYAALICSNRCTPRPRKTGMHSFPHSWPSTTPASSDHFLMILYTPSL